MSDHEIQAMEALSLGALFNDWDGNPDDSEDHGEDEAALNIEYDVLGPLLGSVRLPWWGEGDDESDEGGDTDVSYDEGDDDDTGEVCTQLQHCPGCPALPQPHFLPQSHFLKPVPRMAVGVGG
jgi:hypothetical protein